MTTKKTKVTKKTKAPAKIGRPTKYKPEYCEQLIELGRQGKSRVQCASAFDVCRDTLHEWASKHEAFSYAMKKAQDLAEAYWENKIAEIMESGEMTQVSPTMMFYMKCRFGWRDKDPTTINMDAKTDGDVSFNFNAVNDSDFEPEDDSGKD